MTDGGNGVEREHMIFLASRGARKAVVKSGSVDAA